MSATSDGSRVDRGNADAADGGDRLIFLAEALTLVPFSETTLRRSRRGSPTTTASSSCGATP